MANRVQRARPTPVALAAEQAALAALIVQEQLPSDYRATIDDHWRPIAAAIAAAFAAAGRPLVIGINGAQGSGKSTLCLCLELLLRHSHGLHAQTLSIDDLYLSKADRGKLAAAVHPLLAMRGVPGTHDVDLGNHIIASVQAGHARLQLPRFDKGRDDRVPSADWPIAAKPIDILLFEGWCVAASPQPALALAMPVNRLEIDDDKDMIWRRHVNTALAGPYRALFANIDLLVMLAAPRFEIVQDWRLIQEHKLRARTNGGMTDAELSRFVMHFERLTRHMLDEMPSRVTILVALDDQHRVSKLAIRP
ncbi:kinase [Sandarakinorhabdus sp.]|uniref:kinase n=1 Tax=Sandarakinorhabdus sp. TaxID=1916663 RepID=UPI003340C1E1